MVLIMHEEYEFYERQIKLPFVGKQGQDKLKETKVLIIGAGGLGHPVATYLAGSGVGTIAILDFDKITFSNLHRQFHFNPAQINEFKATILADIIRKQNPYIKIIAIEKYLNFNNAESIIIDYDFIIDCCDNLNTKFLIHDISFKLKKNLIIGSIDQIEGEIKNFNFQTHQDTPCLRCLWPVNPDQNCVQSCAEAGVLPTTAGVFGTLMANEVIKTIFNLQTLKNGESFIFNLNNLDSRKIKWKKSINCPCCSVKSENIKNEIFELERSTIVDINEYKIINLITETPNLAQLNKNQKYLLTCEKGISSLKMAQFLRQEGFNNVWSLCGGIKCL